MPNQSTSSSEMFGRMMSQALTEAFRECCSLALTATAAPTASEPFPAEQQPLWFSVHLQGSLEGRAWVALKKSDIPALSLRNLPTGEDNTAALLHLLQTAGSQLQGFAANRGGSTTVSVEPAPQPMLPDVETLQLLAQSEDTQVQVSFYLFLEAQLLAALQHSGKGLFPEAATDEQPTAENLGLVLDVELNATLRFGQRQLSLREILDLTSGSVVELDRQVDEPIELVLDGRVIARGEAVIIDGNYGMRITEVLQSVQGFAEPR
ncbi:MAG: FliM/FliN family flagellar motor switch protein [Janthinobacterium lividum]